MAGMSRIVVTGSGLGGSPFINTWFVADAIPDLAPLRTFYVALIPLMPLGLIWTLPSGGDVLEETTGAITGSWSATPVATVACNGAGTNTGASGAHVRWRTSGIVAGRRVQGRTFVVPLTHAQFESNGTLLQAAITTIQDAANTLLGAAGLTNLVWARPFPGAAGPPPVPARLGSSHIVTSALVPDLATVLRSRRPG